jgi:ABC-type Fe3+-hydroxamate transport system substrate-binding protein
MKLIGNPLDSPANVSDPHPADDPAPPEGLLVDAAGNRHDPVAASAARIVSLVPSLTELLFDLDLAASVVGRTAYCVHPPAAKGVRSVGGTKTINLEKLRRLRPTHVVVNIDETPRALAEALQAEGWTVVVTHPVEVHDNLALYRLFGALFQRKTEAEALATRFTAALSAMGAAASDVPERRVLYLIWKSPWMTVSRETYISRMLASGGLRTEPERTQQRYPAVELDESLLAGLDLVLFASEPFPFQERHLADFRTNHPLHAAKAMAIDGEMISWYGSRAIAGLGYLARFVRALA